MTQPSFARSATEGRPGLLRQKRYGGQARDRVNAELQTSGEQIETLLRQKRYGGQARSPSPKALRRAGPVSFAKSATEGRPGAA